MCDTPHVSAARGLRFASQYFLHDGMRYICNTDVPSLLCVHA